MVVSKVMSLQRRTIGKLGQIRFGGLLVSRKYVFREEGADIGVYRS